MSENRSSPGAPALAGFRHLTQARIALGASGGGVPTKAALRFGLDHARAREAVWTAFDPAKLQDTLAPSGIETMVVQSQAVSRESYVRRPDLGRLLAREDHQALQARHGEFDLAIVVADGLSATAVALNGASLTEALHKEAHRRGWRVAPVVLARQARVAIGDPVGEALGARAVAVLIGERPGLSAADSLGAYLTFGPTPGLPDSRRNCISNIREGGLGTEEAASLATELLGAMFAQGLSGVGLKRDGALLNSASEQAISSPTGTRIDL